MYKTKPDSDGLWWVHLTCSNHGELVKLVTVRTLKTIEEAALYSEDIEEMVTTCCVSGFDEWLKLSSHMFKDKAKWIKFEGTVPEFPELIDVDIVNEDLARYTLKEYTLGDKHEKI